MRTSAAAKAQLREQILLSAIPFLKEAGFAGAPVDKIMASVGLTSGALYSHFKSKDDFYHEVVLRELVRRNDLYRSEAARIGARAMLENLINNYLSDKHLIDVANGCTYAALGDDLKRASPTQRERYERLSRELIEIVAGAFDGEDRLAKARFVFTSLIGAVVFARAMQSKESARAVLSATRTQLQTMLA